MGVSVQVLIQPADEPLTLAEAKLACRVDDDLTAEDDLISNYITTARCLVEDERGLVLISRTLLVTYDRFPRYSQSGIVPYESEGFWDQRIPGVDMPGKSWPDRAAFRIPRWPLQSITAIQYTDSNGDLQTVPAANYRVDYTSNPPRVMPSYGNTWPFATQQVQSVSIRGVFGYGPATSIAATTATGLQTVTPASMYGIYAHDLTTDPIYPGTSLAIGTGQNREVVTVTSATSTTFTATFRKSHPGICYVLGGIPETIRTRMKMLVAHWYGNREAVAPGQYGTMPLAEECFRWNAWNGELN